MKGGEARGKIKQFEFRHYQPLKQSANSSLLKWLLCLFSGGHASHDNVSKHFSARKNANWSYLLTEVFIFGFRGYVMSIVEADPTFRQEIKLSSSGLFLSNLWNSFNTRRGLTRKDEAIIYTSAS
jgi:hypothetical protein